MELSVLSVIDLAPRPGGDLAVSMRVRDRGVLDELPPAPCLSCLFGEPSGPLMRMRVGVVELDRLPEPGCIDEGSAEPGAWLGCLPQLIGAGDALRSQDLDVLLASSVSCGSVWFEVDLKAGVWQVVDVERARVAFADTRVTTYTKSFFVHATGDRAAVLDMLNALRNESAKSAANP